MAQEETISYMGTNFSVLTPYLSGSYMLQLHLDSFRKFHPNAEILISAFNDEAQDLAEVYGAKYVAEPLRYFDAVKAMISRATNDIVVICDHDTVLLNSLDKYVDMLASDKVDLVSIEENIKHPWADTWMRYAPGFTDMTFFMYDKRKIPSKWPEFDHRECHRLYPSHTTHEGHYGLCRALQRHFYLRPWHTDKYGMGNLLKDGETDVLWHQWYGSYRVRPITEKGDRVYKYGGKEYLKKAEEAFLADYPDKLEFNNIRPAYVDNG